MSGPVIVVHRSAQEIGGNCVEIRASDGRRLVIDAGRPLDAAPDVAEADLLPATLDLARPVEAVLVSHPHQDHHGLVAALPADWPVACGAATDRLIRLTARFAQRPVREPAAMWRSGQEIRFGPFSVVPFLTDHSAFDAYMLLIDVEGRRVLYSGDFRVHGRKAALVEAMIDRPPSGVDVLLLEGTNLGTGKPHQTEAELEARFASLFRTAPGRVFVGWSPQNVDRTVTLFRAARANGRTLVVDLYGAETMDTVAAFSDRLPRPGIRDMVVVVTRAMRHLYRDQGMDGFVEEMVRRGGVAAERLVHERGRWVVMVRDSLIRDFEKAGIVPDADDRWCFSQWSGYLRERRGRRLAEWFESGGTPAEHIHTSGHASPADLLRFARAVAAKRIVPIHSATWPAHVSDFPNAETLPDGMPLPL